MKIKRLAFVSTLFAFLLPTLVVGTVVLTYTYPTSTGGVAPTVYLAQGPNYNAAKALNLFYASQVGNPGNISTGTKIYLNYTYGANNEALLNVLEIVNNVPTGGTVNIIFDQLPSGVTMYISSSADSLLGYSVSSDGQIKITGGTPVSAGTPITLSSGKYYIGFLFGSAPAAGTGTIAFHYVVT